MMEQQFARYLLDRIDEEVETVPEATAKRINTHLEALRGIVDALEPNRARKGGTNA